MKVHVLGLAVALSIAVARIAGADQHEAKPLVGCDKVVETYKKNQSVDETAAALMIDQTRVAECLKGAGIASPAEVDD